jgi:hypothetical protein
MMNTKARYFRKAALAVVAIALLGGVVELLWNAVGPTMFGGAHGIDYPHALGLLILCRILFGGFKGRRGWHAHHQARLEGMTPEEREQFAKRLRGGCCQPRKAPEA